MKNKKAIIIIAMMLILAMTVVGCAPKEEAPAGNTAEKAVVIAMPEEIESSDVQQIRWDNMIHNIMVQPLATYDLELKELIPAQAETFTISEDGKELTFNLTADAKFSNGTALTAEAVKKSMERYIAISPYASDFDPIVEIIAKDEKTVVLKLDSPAAFLWPVLTSVYGGPIDVAAATEAGDEAFSRDAIGNGLFQVESWDQGSQIVFSKNPNFITFNTEVDNKGPALIDKLTVRFIPEDFTRVSELQAGTVDVIVDVPSENIEALKNDANIEVYEYLQTGIDYLSLNVENEHLKDLNVRKALSLAINKDEINTVLKGAVKPRYGLISESQLGFDQATEDKLAQEFAFNVDKAKELLATAGYTDANGDGIVEKDGKPLSLTLMVALDVPQLKQSAPIIQAQLKQIGVNLDLREFESPYIKQSIKDGAYDLATRYFWWSDPDILYYVIHSEADPAWANADVDKMIEDARYIMDMDARTAKYAEVQEATMAEVPLIPLFSEYEYMAARKNVTGIKVGTDGKRILMNDIDITK